MAFSGGLLRAVLPFYDSVFSRVFFDRLAFTVSARQLAFTFTLTAKPASRDRLLDARSEEARNFDEVISKRTKFQQHGAWRQTQHFGTIVCRFNLQFILNFD